MTRLEGLNDLSSEQGPDENLFVVPASETDKEEWSVSGREREKRDATVSDSPSRDDPARLGIHSERSNEISVTCERSEAFSSGCGPDFHAVEGKKTRRKSGSWSAFRLPFPTFNLVQGVKKKGCRDSRSIVTPTNDIILLEIHTRQPSLVPFHRSHALSRNDVPDLDLAVS